MKRSSIRKTTILSLLGISSAQTSSWGEPFVVEPSASASASTDSLLSALIPTPTAIPTPSTSSTWGDAFTVDNSGVSTPTTSLPTSDSSAASLAVDTVTPSGVTVISGIQSAVSSLSGELESVTGSTTETESGTETAESTGTETSASGATVATGAAAVPVRGYKKMGFVGAVGGAAGVVFM